MNFRTEHAFVPQFKLKLTTCTTDQLCLTASTKSRDSVAFCPGWPHVQKSNLQDEREVGRVDLIARLTNKNQNRAC